MPCFNRRLRQLREEAGLSQQELSNQTGVTKSSINMYERGEREPGLETLEIFADYFNVDMNYLTGYQVQRHIRQISEISLTPHETDVITAYRDQPPVQPIVDGILKISSKPNPALIPLFPDPKSPINNWDDQHVSSLKLADDSFSLVAPPEWPEPPPDDDKS